MSARRRTRFLCGVEQLATWVLLDTIWHHATRKTKTDVFKNWCDPAQGFETEWIDAGNCWYILHARWWVHLVFNDLTYGNIDTCSFLLVSADLDIIWHRWQDITSGTMALGCKVSFQVYKDFGISRSENEIPRAALEQVIWSQPVILSGFAWFARVRSLWDLLNSNGLVCRMHRDWVLKKCRCFDLGLWPPLLHSA